MRKSRRGLSIPEPNWLAGEGLCCLPRQDFLVCFLSEATVTLVQCGVNLPTISLSSAGQSWEGQDVWEELAGCEGMRCPHLHKAQEAGRWGRGNQLRPVLCDRKGWKNTHISSPSTYALQAWEAVSHAVASEACWQPHCLSRLYSVTLIQTLDKAKTSNTCGMFHSFKMSPV